MKRLRRVITTAVMKRAIGLCVKYSLIKNLHPTAHKRRVIAEWIREGRLEP